MRKLVLLLVLALSTQLLNAQQSVTINVDMSDVADFDPATRQLDWAGAFDGWTEFFTLTNSSGNIYTVIFNDVAPGYYGGDIYHNDKGASGWGAYGEWSGGPTGVDIMVFVGTEDVVINTKWGETFDLTVSVDMNNVGGFTAGTDNVYFISEDVKMSQTQMMDDDNDGVYTITFNGLPSGHIPTIFAYGADVSSLTQEWDYATNKGDRVVVIDGANVNKSFAYGSPSLFAKTITLTDAVNIYPNPVVGDELSFSLTTNDFSNGNVELIDITGKLLSKNIINGKSGMIDVSNNNSGVHFIRFSKGNKVEIHKVLIK